jgi:hypothetical protein
MAGRHALTAARRADLAKKYNQDAVVQQLKGFKATVRSLAPRAGAALLRAALLYGEHPPGEREARPWEMTVAHGLSGSGV